MKRDPLEENFFAFTVPGIFPTTANRALRSHWRRRHRERKRWGVAILAHAGWPPPGWNPDRRYAVDLVVSRPGLQDPDNRHASVKPVIDALVSLGWIRDDSDRDIVLTVEELVERDPHKRGTFISLAWRIGP